MLDQVREILSQYVEADPSTINEDTLLAEDLGLSSFAFMTMMGNFEETFEITVDETELTDIRSVGDVIEYVKKKQQEA